MAAGEERAYAFANAQAAQRERLRTLEALNDPGTKQQLNTRGVARGWRLTEPRTALRRLVAALRPGGWLVAEELDSASAVPDPTMDDAACARFTRLVQAHNAVLAKHHGFDCTYGRRVAGDLEASGLTDGGCEGRASMWRGGEAGGLIWRLTIAQLRETMIADRLMASADLDAAMALCEEPRFSSLSPVMVAAWGRRPPTRT